MAAKRVLLIGAETDLGAAAAEALAEAGTRFALISSTVDAESAFRVQRLARKLNAVTSQAIDATNEAAVRVMVRQVSKELGGLDATVTCVNDPETNDIIERLATKEMQRHGAALFIDTTGASDPAQYVAAALA